MIATIKFCLALAVGIFVVADRSNAGEFDGWCFPADACTGTPMPIQDSIFDTCEETCRMTNPVNVNDMDAVLYYVECRGDWGSPPTERRLFMRYEDGDDTTKALVLDDGGVTELERCP